MGRPRLVSGPPMAQHPMPMGCTRSPPARVRCARALSLIPFLSSGYILPSPREARSLVATVACVTTNPHSELDVRAITAKKWADPADFPPEEFERATRFYEQMRA